MYFLSSQTAEDVANNVPTSPYSTQWARLYGRNGIYAQGDFEDCNPLFPSLPSSDDKIVQEDPEVLEDSSSPLDTISITYSKPPLLFHKKAPRTSCSLAIYQRNYVTVTSERFRYRFCWSWLFSNFDVEYLRK